MAKKKDIEINVTETSKTIQGKSYQVHQMTIGKKTIGEILTMGEKHFEGFLGAEDLGSFKTLDLAIEAVIMQYNLHD